jgi:hypothetical protein
MEKTVNVFQYTDAVHYIRDCQKAQSYPWTESYRNIARELDTGGPYFWLVAHGKKPFPRKIIEKLPVLMSLKKTETVYFQLLMYLSILDMDKRLRIGILDKFRPSRFHGAQETTDRVNRKLKKKK